jgi:hypothetical protein
MADDPTRVAQAVAQIHETNALVLIAAAAKLLRQNALEESRSDLARFNEEQAKKLDAIWNECFYYKSPPRA